MVILALSTYRFAKMVSKDYSTVTMPSYAKFKKKELFNSIEHILILINSLYLRKILLN